MMHNIIREREIVFKKIHNLVKNNYPFDSQKDVFEFDKLYERFKDDLYKTVTDSDFFILLERFLASLKNGHTKLGKYPTKIFYKPPGLNVYKFGFDFYLVKNEKLLGKINLIDNKKPLKILNDQKKRISSSSRQYLENQALKFILLSQQKKDIVINLEKEGKKLILKFPRISSTSTNNISVHKVEVKLDKTIGYLKVPSWTGGANTMKIFEDKIKYFIKNNIKALIIDVRDNGGGDSKIAKSLAAHFFDKKVLFAKVYSRTKKSSLKLIKRNLEVNPQMPFLNVPIAILINTNCLSSNEYFIAGMRDNDRAVLIGSKTGGSSGNPKKFIFKYQDKELELYISTWKFFRINGKALECHGISPDIRIITTREDLQKKDDKVFNKAVSYLKNII